MKKWKYPSWDSIKMIVVYFLVSYAVDGAAIIEMIAKALNPRQLKKSHPNAFNILCALAVLLLFFVLMASNESTFNLIITSLSVGMLTTATLKFVEDHKKYY
jgi:hypothetical protein